MPIRLVHLSGSHRGRAVTVKKHKFSLGSSRNCRIRFSTLRDPTVKPHHADVCFEDCEYLLRDRSGGHSLVNDQPVEEIFLREGDMIELGVAGPRLRVHVLPDGHCIPIREMMRDTAARSKMVSGGRLRRSWFAARDFVEHFFLFAPRRQRWSVQGAMLVVILVLLVVGVRGFFVRRSLERQLSNLIVQVRADRARQQALIESVERERKEWMVGAQKEREQFQQQHQELLQSQERLKQELEAARVARGRKQTDVARLEAQVRSTGRTIARLEKERTARSMIIQRYSRSVCLIAGRFHFVDANNAPLRFAGLDSSGKPLRDNEGNLIFSVEGTGPVFTITYTGTGFLVSRQGHILTNRHVAEPWWQDEDAARFRSLGLEPKLDRLVAVFPDVGEALALQTDRVSPQADVAMVRLDMDKAPAPMKQLPPVPLETDEKGTAEGDPVILLGYPTGLDAVLAKLDLEVAREVIRANGEDPFRIAADLARRKMLRPSTTQGHLGDVLPNKLVYDALTTVGGSGGPLFNLRGHVLGINFAILQEFSGANFGVPIRFGVQLLREAGVTRVSSADTNPLPQLDAADRPGSHFLVPVDFRE